MIEMQNMRVYNAGAAGVRSPCKLNVEQNRILSRLMPQLAFDNRQEARLSKSPLLDCIYFNGLLTIRNLIGNRASITSDKVSYESMCLFRKRIHYKLGKQDESVKLKLYGDSWCRELTARQTVGRPSFCKCNLLGCDCVRMKTLRNHATVTNDNHYIQTTTCRLFDRSLQFLTQRQVLEEVRRHGGLGFAFVVEYVEKDKQLEWADGLTKTCDLEFIKHRTGKFYCVRESDQAQHCAPSWFTSGRAYVHNNLKLHWHEIEYNFSHSIKLYMLKVSNVTGLKYMSFSSLKKKNVLPDKLKAEVSYKAATRVIDSDSYLDLERQVLTKLKETGLPGSDKTGRVLQEVNNAIDDGMKYRDRLERPLLRHKAAVQNANLQWRYSNPKIFWIVFIVAMTGVFASLLLVIMGGWWQLGSLPVSLVVFIAFSIIWCLKRESGLSWLNVMVLMGRACCSNGEELLLGVPVLFLALMFSVYLLCRLYLERIRRRKFLGTLTTARSTTTLLSPLHFDDLRLKDSETWVDRWKYRLNQALLFVYDHRPPRLIARCAVIAVGTVFTTCFPLVFSTSNHNLVVGVHTRAVLEPPTRPRGDFWDTDFTNLMQIKRGKSGYPVPLTRVFTANKTEHVFKVASWQKYVSRFPPNKRKMLEKARMKLKYGDYSRKQFVYNLFIKREKQMEITEQDFSPVRPRVITGASWPAKTASGVWFYNYSNALKYAWNPTTRLWYCSGYKAAMFNWWFDRVVKKMGGLRNCIFISSDFSKYDVTQGPECIKAEIRWYKQLGFLKKLGKYGEWILDMKMKGKCFGDGVMYTKNGGRSSGDNDTSSGNSGTTGKAMVSCLKDMGFTNFYTAVLGDDNFTILHASELDTRDFIAARNVMVNYMDNSCGFSIKVLITTRIMEAEFLSLKFFPTENGYKVGKKPGRCLCKLGWMMDRQGRTKEDALQLFKGVLLSYLATANHVPFLRVYVWVWLEALQGIKAKHGENDKYIIGYKESRKLCDADRLTWSYFTDFYGLDRADERSFHNTLKRTALRGRSTVMTDRRVERMFRLEQVL